MISSNLNNFLMFQSILIKIASNCTVCQDLASQIHSIPTLIFLFKEFKGNWNTFKRGNPVKTIFAYRLKKGRLFKERLFSPYKTRYICITQITNMQIERYIYFKFHTIVFRHTCTIELQWLEQLLAP